MELADNDKMEITERLHTTSREQWREWLSESHSTKREIWISTTKSPDGLQYLDAVEEALCFGWIDSTLKRLPDGRLVQRLSPRRPKSHWTQLNLDRCMDLEDRGLMTDAGRIAFEKAFEYNVVAPDSEINQMIEDENKRRRPELYK